MNQFKNTDQTSSIPQSQEQPPRSKKYKIKNNAEILDANNNSSLYRSMSAA